MLKASIVTLCLSLISSLKFTVAIISSLNKLASSWNQPPLPGKPSELLATPSPNISSSFQSVALPVDKVKFSLVSSTPAISHGDMTNEDTTDDLSQLTATRISLSSLPDLSAQPDIKITTTQSSYSVTSERIDWTNNIETAKNQTLISSSRDRSNDDASISGQAKAFFDWLGLATAAPTLHQDSQLVTDDPPARRPCDENCTTNQGVCVLGADFTPSCLVKSDACRQFPCVHGSCVSSRTDQYSCQCRPGWVGPFCDKACNLDCGRHGQCAATDNLDCGQHGQCSTTGLNDTVGCVCHLNYTGTRCQHRRVLHTWTAASDADDDLKVWESVILVMTSAVLLVLTGVVLPYYLWRRQWVPMRRLVFYFQQYEDDDNKQYDAFVSYKSVASDEEFILQHLYPKLENELQYKLCLHFRDFPPGEPIANNIIQAIEGSRRTILVLSPSFVSSEWCRLEYQKAQHEMLKLKHKIIPIVIQDISGLPDVDINLRTILNSVTYITWPGGQLSTSSSRQLAKFWKLLELAMPKRRLKDGKCSGDSCSEVTTVPNTPSSDLDLLPDFRIASIQDYNISDLEMDETFKTQFSKRFCEQQDVLRDGLFNVGPEDDKWESLHRSYRKNITFFPPVDTHIKGGSNQSLNSISNEMVISDCEMGHNDTYFHKCDLVTDHQDWSSQKSEAGLEETDSKTVEDFFTSDDHIIKIRQSLFGKNNIIVTSRPRRLKSHLV